MDFNALLNSFGADAKRDAEVGVSLAKDKGGFDIGHDFKVIKNTLQDLFSGKMRLGDAAEWKNRISSLDLPDGAYDVAGIATIAQRNIAMGADTVLDVAHEGLSIDGAKARLKQGFQNPLDFGQESQKLENAHQGLGAKPTLSKLAESADLDQGTNVDSPDHGSVGS